MGTQITEYIDSVMKAGMCPRCYGDLIYSRDFVGSPVTRIIEKFSCVDCGWLDKKILMKNGSGFDRVNE